MTRHRSKEEWIEEILEASREEIDSNGYVGFSMESIVRRTDLSKGGIYRFFSNKSDVGLELFARAYREVLSFDINECLDWKLPLSETIFRLISRYTIPEEEARRGDRIWVRLLPEVLHDKRFREVRAELLDEIRHKMMELAKLVAKRDGLRLPDDFEKRAWDALSLGVGLIEGFSIQSALGSSIEHQGLLVKSFVKGLIENLFE